jgi:hypothetical protein
MMQCVSMGRMVLPKILLFGLISIASVVATVYFHNRGSEQAPTSAPLSVIRSYLRATYARDYREAYRFISAADQRVRDEASYLQVQGEFTGFTARVAATLADFMDVKVLEQTSHPDRAKIKVGYSVPAPEEVSSLVFHWDSEKLNSLSPVEQKQVLDRLVARKRSGNLVAIQGHETFELLREGNVWKIFQDWASGTKVKLQTVLSERSDVDVKLSQSEIITKTDEPFQVNLKVTNRGRKRVILAMRHLVEPNKAADDLEMIECGLRGPVALEPGREQEYSMAYFLSESTRKSIRDLTLTYAFDVKK